MTIKPLVEAVLYALAAQRLGMLHPRINLVMDAYNGPAWASV